MTKHVGRGYVVSRHDCPMLCMLLRFLYAGLFLIVFSPHGACTLRCGLYFYLINSETFYTIGAPLFCFFLCHTGSKRAFLPPSPGVSLGPARIGDNIPNSCWGDLLITWSLQRAKICMPDRPCQGGGPTRRVRVHLYHFLTYWSHRQWICTILHISLLCQSTHRGISCC